MKKLKIEVENKPNPMLEQFRKILVRDIQPARKAYEKEKEKYELAMKKVIESEICGKKEFKKYFKENFDHLKRGLGSQSAKDFIDEFYTLEFIIDTHECDLEDDVFGFLENP